MSLISRKSVSLEEIFDKHARELLGYTRAILRNQELAEDALQETFVRLLRRPDRLADVSNIRSYLFRMARNEALRMLQREKRRVEKQEEFVQYPLFEPVSKAEDSRDDIEKLGRALAQLPDEQREVVFLKCLENFTFAEIGNLLDIPQNTAASRYRYGIEKLKVVMETKLCGKIVN